MFWMNPKIIIVFKYHVFFHMRYTLTHIYLEQNLNTIFRYCFLVFLLKIQSMKKELRD